MENSKESIVIRPEKPRMDFSKIDKSITKLIERDIKKFDAIAEPAMKFRVKKGDEQYNKLMDDFKEQIKNTITDDGKQNLTPYGEKMLESADYYITMQDFKSLYEMIYGVYMGGLGLGMSRFRSMTEGLDKNAEQIIEEVVKIKTQSS